MSEPEPRPRSEYPMELGWASSRVVTYDQAQGITMMYRPSRMWIYYPGNTDLSPSFTVKIDVPAGMRVPMMGEVIALAQGMFWVHTIDHIYGSADPTEDLDDGRPYTYVVVR